MNAVRRGASHQPDPAHAARELADKLAHRTAGAAVFFCSSRYDLERLGTELSNAFDGVELIGCSSAGEIGPSGYADRSIVGLSFARDEYEVVTACCDDVSVSSLMRVCAMTHSLVQRLHVRAPGATGKNTFALLLIDGLAGVEEPVLSAIARELGTIPLIGGSAADNLRFRETLVFHQGEFRAGGAVLALLHTSRPFEVFKTQHIVSSDTKMVITEADPVRRVVTEINAEPASEEYARTFGLDRRTLAPMTLATHPVVVRVGGDDYVRSIQRVNADGSLTFYCAIDEGLVLAAGSGTDIVADLDRLFARIRDAIGVPEAVLGFDCIFRRLEMRQRSIEGRVSQLLADNNVIGFSTYGEQVNAMHLNQTFSGIAFGAAAS